MRPVHIARALGVVVSTILFAPVVVLLSLLDRDARIAWRVARGWVWLNTRLSGVRLRVCGLENLDPDRSYVFMSNHRSNADILAIATALRPFQIRWVAKQELARLPFFGWALRALGNVIIDRKDRERAIASYRHARERMERGISVIIYPEGTRGRGRGMLPFKKGGFVLALETGIPVVPVALVGTAEVLACDGWRIHDGDVEVRIGRPIPTAGRGVEDRDRLIAEVRASIEEMLTEDRPHVSAAPERAVGDD